MTDLEPRPDSGGFTVVIAACVVVGRAGRGRGALRRAGGRRRCPRPAPRRSGRARAVPANATEEYGRRLVAHTAELLGQDHPDPARRYINSRLNCGSCHLATGTEPGTLTLLQTDEHYPRFSGRAGAQTDIEDRINECMTRSMNGKPLPMDSPEMMAMAAYLRSLGAQYDAMGASLKKAEEPARLQDADRAPRTSPWGRSSTARAARSATATTAWGCWPPPTAARATCSRRSGGPTASTTAPACTAC